MDPVYYPVLYEGGVGDVFTPPLPLESFSGEDIDSYFSFDDSPPPSILPPTSPHLPPTPPSLSSPAPKRRVKDEGEERKAVKRTRGLAHIDVPQALSAPTSPFTLSPSTTSGSVSPIPSTSPSPSPPPPHLPSLLAESALKRTRLARKAELARLGRKRKNETIDKYQEEVERLEKELRGVRGALERERKAHRKTTRMLAEKAGELVERKVTPPLTLPPPPVVKVEVEGAGAVCDAMLAALVRFCCERGMVSASVQSASALLGFYMKGIGGTVGGEQWVKAVQGVVVEGDANAGLLARFLLWWMAQPARKEEVRGDVAME